MRKQTKELIAFWIGVIALAVLMANNINQLIQLNQLFDMDKSTINIISGFCFILSFIYLKIIG